MKSIANFIKGIDWEGVIIVGVFVVLIFLALVGRGGQEFYPGK